MNIDNKFLLVCLIIVLVMSMIVEGMPTVNSMIESSRNPFQELSISNSKATQRGNRNERVYRLYNVCASKDVVILDKVSANATDDDPNGELILESMFKHKSLVIRIRGAKSGKYLCYSRVGKLVSRPQAKGKRCEFKEEQNNDHFLYKSMRNNTWSIGFNRVGQPLRYKEEYEGSMKRECFRFYKRGSSWPNQYPSSYTKNTVNIDEHNRHLRHRQPPPPVESWNQRPKTHRLRHEKKSHRQTHLQKYDADR